jgi:formylglycine-generating enzyme required for sulfatase activity
MLQTHTALASGFRRAAIVVLAACAALAVAPAARAQGCTGDIVADGRIDGGDLGTLLSNWGPVVVTNPISRACDLDQSGLVDGFDLSVLLGNWGWCAASVAGMTPVEGCFLGGTTVTIIGTHLGTATAVTIGGVPATGVTVLSPSTVTAVAPAGALGPAAVRLTTAAGTVTAPQPFTYMPASVSSIAPNTGTAAGGSQITITGAYLALTTGVTIGGAPCSNVTVVSATTVTAVTPAGTLGNADVVITGGKGTITVPGGYRYVSIVVPSWATLVEAQPNPAVVTDPALRAAIAATGLAWRVRDTGTQMEMMLIPPGTFQMGCIMGSNEYGCYSWDRPVHQVTLTNAFYLGRYEVTQSQWVAKMGSNPSTFQGQSDSPSRPVEQVSWNAIQSYLSATGMRLPTEAEWEFACRAGTQTPFYNGSTDDSTVGTLAWYASNAGSQTHAVGGKAANAFGLHDMLGNVWEWVNDWFNTYPSSAQTNPTGPVSASTRVVRGGSWYLVSNFVRSSYRYSDTPGYTNFDLGFRVARTP